MPWQAASHENSLPTATPMDSQLAPTLAGNDADESSPADGSEPRCRRIQTYVDGQRARIAAIQRELAEHLSRLSRERGQAQAASQEGATERAELERALDQLRAECEPLRTRLASAETELPRLRQEL